MTEENYKTIVHCIKNGETFNRIYTNNRFTDYILVQVERKVSYVWIFFSVKDSDTEQWIYSIKEGKAPAFYLLKFKFMYLQDLSSKSLPPSARDRATKRKITAPNFFMVIKASYFATTPSIHQQFQNLLKLWIATEMLSVFMVVGCQIICVTADERYI